MFIFAGHHLEVAQNLCGNWMRCTALGYLGLATLPNTLDVRDQERWTSDLSLGWSKWSQGSAKKETRLVIGKVYWIPKCKQFSNKYAFWRICHILRFVHFLLDLILRAHTTDTSFSISSSVTQFISKIHIMTDKMSQFMLKVRRYSHFFESHWAKNPQFFQKFTFSKSHPNNKSLWVSLCPFL